MKEFSEQELIRRNKVDQNTKNGISSYLKKQKISHKINQIIDDFSKFSKEELH